MSQNRDVMRQHSNKAHNKKRVADEELFQSRQLQSWFDDPRARYWIVNQRQQDEQERQTRSSPYTRGRRGNRQFRRRQHRH